MAGKLLGVVGPSGVGKDSVMQAVAEARPGIALVRRVITRPTEAGGEDFEGTTEADFAARAAAGEFLLSWQAHGLNYGVPRAVLDQLAAGQHLLVNLSRGVLPEAQRRVPGFACLLLSAPLPVLAERLAARGREDAAEIERRLARAGFALPEGVVPHEVDNSGALDDTVRAVLQILDAQQIGADADMGHVK
ncbi:ribose 1,5-bisphosphokinase [Pseudooceanicola antarcticus]|uniref:Ribose 1,5-bisphosphate phosphokinase PhnN n=1 Tax=Pseudooceanicola antarcticus TaxID=1247613 RepID=A0A285JHG8_9RHOB|nr:phosphonate metabolism protein/1,5-bisphosphokinase (PRPP-forming) PhnN [Pseudooceanicola antarcticus]PJE31049.1 phosphonate metabolism protein/1,5-bisphosphokinase (PRPP-forming) PhnN [Pseudooceanicola antarcticus]SNY58816.1 ribose 1,5-bisphosphokinase [Pseudooceanicola antarcticus]